MSRDEISIAAIYNGEPAGTPEQEAAKLAEQRKQRLKLPKFELPEGVKFYISRERLNQINTAYNTMLDAVDKGKDIANAEMKSYMHSVIFASYVSEIWQEQRDGAEKAESSEVSHAIKRAELSPGYHKRFFWSRKKPNRALQQCRRQARIEADMEYAARDEELSKQAALVYGVPEEIQEIYDKILDEFFSRQRRKRFTRKHGERLMVVLTEYTQNIIRILSEQIREQLKELQECGEDDTACGQELEEPVASEEPEVFDDAEEGDVTEELDKLKEVDANCGIDIDELDELDDFEDEEELKVAPEEAQQVEMAAVYTPDTEMAFVPMSASDLSENPKEWQELPEESVQEDKEGDKND